MRKYNTTTNIGGIRVGFNIFKLKARYKLKESAVAAMGR